MSDAPTEPTTSTSHYTSATQPLTPTPMADPAPAKKRSPGTAGMVAIATVVAAVVGGASGAGIEFALNANSSNSGSNAPSPSSITVNNAKNATTITAVAAKASPSIVTINATSSQEAGTGSGIILNVDGYVITNNHVVTLDGESADPKIQVETNDGRLFAAKVVGTDPIDDLAVIKLQGASGLQPAQFADSSKLNVGDMAIAIGAPLGLSGSVTNGIISALNRSITVQSSAAPSGGDSSGDSGNGNGQSSPFNFWNFGDGTPSQNQPTTASSTISLSVIQTDAAINPGNSGGALLDSDGKVIGINCAIASASDSSTSGGQSGSIGVGFAIPSDIALRIANDIIKTGSASHGLLGVTVQDVTTDGSETSSKVVGAKVDSVTSGGAGAHAGLKVGDVVTGFNGVPISNATDLTAQVRSMQAGARASLTYVRDGKSKTVSVTLGELK